MVTVAIKTMDVEEAEFITPRHDEMRVRTAQGTFEILTRQHDLEAMNAICSTPELKVYNFGEKAIEDEKLLQERIRRIIQEEAQQVVRVPDAVVPKLSTKTIVVNADNPEAPTMAITMPAVLPPVVEVMVTQLPSPRKVDKASIDPQVEVVISEVSPVVPEGSSVVVLPTPAVETADLAVVMNEVQSLNVQKAEAIGSDIPGAVVVAIEQHGVVAPPKAEESTLITPQDQLVPVEALEVPEVTMPEVPEAPQS